MLGFKNVSALLIPGVIFNHENKGFHLNVEKLVGTIVGKLHGK